MSKPKEFWIPQCVEDYEWKDSEGYELPLINVVEKSAYDKVVETLKIIAKREYPLAEKTLKDLEEL